jgi:hypothetical protein
LIVHLCFPLNKFNVFYQYKVKAVLQTVPTKVSK